MLNRIAINRAGIGKVVETQNQALIETNHGSFVVGLRIKQLDSSDVLTKAERNAKKQNEK